MNLDLNAKWWHYQNNDSITVNDAKDIKRCISNILESYDKYNEVLSNLRLEASLKRFDNWFKYFNKIQNWRWLVVDSLMPIIVAIIAIWYL